jgi:NADH:ubiquinone oxidoreductase subunit 6 (subunit J)
MSSQLPKKTWVSVTTALSFIILGITGALMLFHVRVSFVSLELLHIAMGAVFVTIGFVHLLLNRKALAAHLKQRSTVIAVAAVVLLCVALSLFGPEEHKGPPNFQDNGRNGPGFQAGIDE